MKIKQKEYKTKVDILWYFKQLLPLTYWTKYIENGKQWFTIWNMWFGRSFNITKFELK